jgi:D-hydroxyproline dehydrogenase subunit gamma
MPEEFAVRVNGKPIVVAEGATAVVAISLRGAACRKSVSGEPRGPLCGMGICFECRATIDGKPHRRSCQILCRPGMEIETDG